MWLSLTLPAVGWASWLTPPDLFWDSLGLFLVPLVLVASRVPLRSPPRRAHAGPALLVVGICSGLVGEALALFPYVLWTHAWYDQYGDYLAFLGGFFLLSAGLVALASLAALTDTSWARGGLRLLRVVMGVIGAGSLVGLLYQALICSSCVPDQTLWGLLDGVLYLLRLYLLFFTGLLLTLSPLYSPLIVVGALIALVRLPTLRAIVLREGVLGTLGAALVIVLLVVRGPGDWKEAPFGLDILLASFAVGTVLFLLESRRTRHRTPAGWPPEAQYRSRSPAVLSFHTTPSVPPESDPRSGGEGLPPG